MRTRFKHLLFGLAGLLAFSASAALAEGSEEEAEPEVFAAIIDLRDERAEYDGTFCPPDPNEEFLCLGSSILIQKGQVHRYIGARPKTGGPEMREASGRDVSGKFIRFRFIAGHAMIQIEGTRYLAIIEPTDSGYVYLQWREVYEHGRPCFPADLLDHYGDRLKLKLGELREDGSRCVTN